MKKTFNIEGEITFIGNINTFQRKGKKSISNAEISVITEDNQKVFMEVRKNNFQQLSFLRKGIKVSIDYFFEGSEKGNRRFNNIIVQSINVL